jgi:phosphohistidine phosphatase SixA
MIRALLVACSFAMLAPSMAAAQSVVFAVRHAERADAGKVPPNMSNADPDLSEAGRERAKSLASMLKDANITAIFTTEFKRTIQTATPLADLLKIKIQQVSSKTPPDELAKRVRAAKGNVLVVGHSNADSVAGLLTSLGIKDKVEIGEQDFDNLFVVIRSATPRLVRMHYR